MQPNPNPAIEEIIEKEFPCLNHGFVRLIDFMGSDEAVVRAARVSYGEGTKKTRQDRGLIRYLMRHQHTTPFEMVEFKFHCKMPIFVARQWIRHRTASVNEYSLRYSKAINQFYIPAESELKLQTQTNRQGRAAETLTPSQQQEILDILQTGVHQAWDDYEKMEASGLSRELSRISLPLSLYTEWYWKIDLHNLLHFLKLRLHAHAQYEIRVYAQIMADIVQTVVPISWEAFEDYILHANSFSRQELTLIRQALAQSNQEINWEKLTENSDLSKREISEFLDKIEPTEKV